MEELRKGKILKAGGRFIAMNRATCDRIEGILPVSFTRSLLQAHLLVVVAEISRRPPETRVLDIGGGRDSPFATELPKRNRPTVIALDISESQITKNQTTDFGIVADACQGLPLKDASIDVAVTRSLLEHLPDPRVAVGEIARVLRPNGVCIHVFPCQFSPFSVLNRIIPAKLARRLLFTFFPEWADTSGFPAFYRYCDPPAMTRLHRQAGLNLRSLELRYYQSIYYKFFLPFYLLSLVYDLAIYGLGLSTFACQVLMIAEKPAEHVERARSDCVSARAGSEAHAE
ncbi:MAG: class I SAM-dependent methyltransferase [Stellaceae bacterium]